MTVQDVEGESPARGHRRPLTFGTKAFFGVGSVANGAYAALAGLTMFFYSQVVGVPPHIASLAISAVIFIDGFWDPLIGHSSDQVRSRIGRRHPFIYLALLLIPVALFLRWHPPGWEASAMFWYILGTGLFLNLAWSLYEVPSGALAPELAPDYHDRTVLLGYRWMLGTLGTALATVLIYGIFLKKTPEHPVGQLNADGYGPLSIAITLIFVIAGLTMALGTQKQAAGFHQRPHEPGRTFRDDWRDALVTLTNRNFLVALSAQVIAGLAFGIAAGLTLYFQTYLWELKAQDILILTLMGIPGPILGGIVAPRLARRFGKKKAAMGLFLTSVIFGHTPMFLKLIGVLQLNGTPALLWVLATFTLVQTICAIAGYILASSMIGDIVEEVQVRTGRRAEGLLTTADSLPSKIVNAIAALIPGLILTAVAFPTKAQPSEKTMELITQVAWLYLPTVLVLFLGSIASWSFYRLDEESHARNLETIAGDRP
ncbi:MAG: MFS transporter [Phenylobacterium sp.]|uniref:MFS transporter n=1 Tax=Phenylobacterium sp. TaxID=1871053 RepID=UPI0025DCAC37|nr:MFS transporter [Phenylobacterium sp.]MCA6298806.1 MFS transporter [Phenylobacterium sp.]